MVNVNGYVTAEVIERKGPEPNGKPWGDYEQDELRPRREKADGRSGEGDVGRVDSDEGTRRNTSAKIFIYIGDLTDINTDAFG
jgi:hypothetical protein